MEEEAEGSGRGAREWKRKSRKVEEEGKESKGGGEISDGGMEEEGRKRLPKRAEAGHPLGVTRLKTNLLFFNGGQSTSSDSMTPLCSEQ